MAKYKSIEEYRNKKKLKSFFKGFITLAIIVAILIGLVNVLQLFKGTPIDEIFGNSSDGLTDSFPVIIKDEQLLDIYNLGNNISVLTKGNTINYMTNGKRGEKISHGYTNPVVKEGNKRILVYDRGGNSFRVNTNSGTVGEKRLEHQIMSAQIAANGNIAVVTNHNQYASIITVYDDKLNEIFKYSSSDRITFVNFSPDGKRMLAASIITDNAILSTSMLEIDITNDIPAKKMTVSDSFLLDVSYGSGSKIVLVCSDKVITYDKKSEEQVVFEYTGELVAFSNSTINETIILTKNPINEKADIYVIGETGQSKSHTAIDDEIKDIYCDGSRIILLGKNGAYNYDMTLMLLNQINTDKPYNKIIFNGDSLYILGVDTVAKYAIS